MNRFLFQTTLTPEYKGHTSDPCSPNMCGFLTPGKPGSELPGRVPTQTMVNLNTTPANTTFWHFPATGEYPLALKPHQGLRFITQPPSSHLFPPRTSFYQHSTEKCLCGIISCYLAFTQEKKFTLLNAHGDLGNQHTRMLCRVFQLVLAI